MNSTILIKEQKLAPYCDIHINKYERSKDFYICNVSTFFKVTNNTNCVYLPFFVKTFRKYKLKIK